VWLRDLGRYLSRYLVLLYWIILFEIRGTVYRARANYRSLHNLLILCSGFQHNLVYLTVKGFVRQRNKFFDGVGIVEDFVRRLAITLLLGIKVG